MLIISLYFEFVQRDDNMTFKDDIDAADEQYWSNAREDRMMDIIDACVNKIDELESRLKTLSGAVAGLHYRQHQPPAQDPIPGLSQDVLNDAVEVFKATVAQKKQELEKKNKEEQHD